MTNEIEKEDLPVKELTFECKFCQSAKPLDEMVVITKFFPPIIACRDCEKKIQ